MKSLYKTLAAATGAGLIALGVYQFKDYTPLTDNPNLTIPVAEILGVKNDLEKIRNQLIETYNSRPETANIWTFDDKSRELLDKLNEPTQTQLNTLQELYRVYGEEFIRRTTTNKAWETYCQWEKDTKAKNKSDLTYGIISVLSGIGLLALSKKN
jgi:hypothetical protein